MDWNGGAYPRHQGDPKIAIQPSIPSGSDAVVVISDSCKPKPIFSESFNSDCMFGRRLHRHLTEREDVEGTNVLQLRLCTILKRRFPALRAGMVRQRVLLLQ